MIKVNKDLEILCYNLRFLKMKYRLTQKELAKIGKVSLTSIVNFLNNQPPAKVGVEFLANIAEYFNLEIPLYSSFGCKHCHFGKNVYANFGLTMIDDTHIYVGDNTLIGPNVVLATAGHPIDPELRRQGLQYNASVKIGKNCWLGAGVIVVPGVTIGDNTVIGAGSIVTKDIPSGVVAVGNPCRVLREVNERDREYYFKDRKTPQEFFK